MQRHLRVKQKFDGSGPFGTEDKRNSATCAGVTGSAAKKRARAMRRSPFEKRSRS